MYQCTNVPMTNLKLPDPNVAEPDAVAVVLEGDMAAGRLGVAGQLGKFAALHLSFPGLAADLVFHHHNSVEPVLHAAVFHDDAGTVPLAGRLGGRFADGLQVVVG